MVKPAITVWAGIDPTAVGGALAVTVTAKVWVAAALAMSLAVTVMTATPADAPVIFRTPSGTGSVAGVGVSAVAGAS